MNVLDACRWAEVELGEIEFPRLEAELLLCDLMNWKRHHIYLNHTSNIHGNLLLQYREMVERRRNREPLQHITGKVDFLGRCFICSPGALIPRPETEFITDRFIKELSSPEHILDVGTGSGVIAVSLALAFPAALVIGIDISPEALAVSRRNKELLGADNLFFVRSDLTTAFGEKSGIFDGIVANLPYIPSNEICDLEPEVRNGDPMIALDGGADGLELVSLLTAAVPELLKRDGILALELDPGQVSAISDDLENCSFWKDIKTFRDLAGHRRIVTARRI